MAIVYHSAAGGTRIVAELLGELLSTDHDVGATGIYEAGAVAAAEGADLLVLCYPTYFLRPSPSMKEFIGRLAPSGPRAAFLVTTYEVYAENSLRACALLLRNKGIVVTGSAAVRAPGSDLNCVLPDWLCPWLYLFRSSLPQKLQSIAREVQALARAGGRERPPRPKLYTPIAQALQRGFLQRVHSSQRCASWRIWRPSLAQALGNAIVLRYRLKDNKRLDARHYARLKAMARTALLSPGEPGRKAV